MKTPLGPRLPTDPEIRRLLDDIGGIAERLKHYTGGPVAEDEDGRLGAARDDSERVVAVVEQLATSAELQIPGVPVTVMTAELELARRLQPIADALAAVLSAVDETVLASESVCWETATAYYDALVRISDADPALRAALRPVADYFGGQRGGSWAIASA